MNDFVSHYFTAMSEDEFHVYCQAYRAAGGRVTVYEAHADQAASQALETYLHAQQQQQAEVQP